ncbi:hypothetical protein [Pontibacter cellulosilyticus]|nr:hypothetical protein [Pontibacter cellulosilyticus]
MIIIILFKYKILSVWPFSNRKLKHLWKIISGIDVQQGAGIFSR